MNRLLELQLFCKSVETHKNIQHNLLSESDWEQVMRLVSILKPFDKYMKSLQSDNVTLSDFFGFWTMLRIKLAKSSDNFSEQLLSEMNGYHDTLMNNLALLAAIYLDPRFQRGLKDKLPIAKQFLVNLYIRMKKVEAFQEIEEETEEIHFEAEHNSENDSYDDMDSYLNACNSFMTTPIAQPCRSTNDQEIIINLLNYFEGAQEPIKSSIWDIWNGKKYDTELYRLAMTVFSIPPTQSTVKRAFSFLPIILTSRRTRIGDESLQNILLIRLNQNI